MVSYKTSAPFYRSSLACDIFLTIQVTIELKTKRNVRKESVRKVSQRFTFRDEPHSIDGHWSYYDLLGCYGTIIAFSSIQWRIVKPSSFF